MPTLDMATHNIGWWFKIAYRFVSSADVIKVEDNPAISASLNAFSVLLEFLLYVIRGISVGALDQ
jgi:hypothetical protein